MSENYGGRRPEDEGNQPENGVDQDQNQWRPGAGSANEAPQQQWGEPQQQWNNQDSQPQGVGSANEAPQQWGNQEPQQFQATSAPEAGQYGQGFDPNANQQFQASSAPEAGQYGQGVGSANGAPQQWGSQEPQQFQASSAPEAGQYGQDYGQVPYGASAQQTGQYNPNQNQQGQNFGGGQYNQGQQGVNPSGQPGYGGQFGGQYRGGFGQPPYGGNGGYGQPPQSNKGKMVGWIVLAVVVVVAIVVGILFATGVFGGEGGSDGKPSKEQVQEGLSTILVEEGLDTETMQSIGISSEALDNFYACIVDGIYDEEDFRVETLQGIADGDRFVDMNTDENSAVERAAQSCMGELM